jgi:hypothetical protein
MPRTTATRPVIASSFVANRPAGTSDILMLSYFLVYRPDTTAVDRRFVHAGPDVAGYHPTKAPPIKAR